MDSGLRMSTRVRQINAALSRPDPDDKARRAAERERVKVPNWALVKKSLPSFYFVMHRSSPFPPLLPLLPLCRGISALLLRLSASRDWQNFYPRHQKIGEGGARVENLLFKSLYV